MWVTWLIGYAPQQGNWGQEQVFILPCLSLSIFVMNSLASGLLGTIYHKGAIVSLTVLPRATVSET